MKILSRLKTANWQAPAAWVFLAAFALTHAGVIAQLPFTVENYLWVLPLAATVPGLLSMALLPGAWRRWYRWAAIAALAGATYFEAYLLILVVAETWALHRMWVIERTVPLKRLFTGHRTGTITPRTAKPRTA